MAFTAAPSDQAQRKPGGQIRRCQQGQKTKQQE